MSEPDHTYCYPPDYTVLKNKLGIRDARVLAITEREHVAQRIAEGVPEGQFDLRHLQAIHKQLFQDVYEWAGELRTVEISKGGHQFQIRRYIVTGMEDIHRRLVSRNYLRGLSREDFAQEAGQIMGDVNYVHPFREGNGRAQLQYLGQLAQQAGHELKLRQIGKAAWIEASRQAHQANYVPMAKVIESGLLNAQRGRGYEGRGSGRGEGREV